MVRIARIISQTVLFHMALLVGTVAIAGAAKGNNRYEREFAFRFGTQGPLLVDQRNLPPCFSYRRKPQANIAVCTNALWPGKTGKPNASAALPVKATVLALHQKTDQALSLINREQAILKSSPELNLLAARIALGAFHRPDRNQYINAFNHLIGRARDLAPANLKVLATQGYGQLMQADYPSARATFDRVLTLKPDHLFALRYRAEIHRVHGRIDLALADLERAVQSAPKAITARGLRGDIYLAAGRFEEALVDLDAIVRGTPYHRDALVKRASVWYKMSNNERALADFDRLLNRDRSKPIYVLGVQDRSRLLFNRAMVYRSLGRNGDAANDILRALEIGGRTNILTIQIFLRRNGYEKLKINGQVSKSMKEAVQDCFSSANCLEELGQSLEGPSFPLP